MGVRLRLWDLRSRAVQFENFRSEHFQIFSLLIKSICRNYLADIRIVLTSNINKLRIFLWDCVSIFSPYICISRDVSYVVKYILYYFFCSPFYLFSYCLILFAWYINSFSRPCSFISHVCFHILIIFVCGANMF